MNTDMFEIEKLLMDNLTFKDIQPVDKSYYKNVKWKIDKAQALVDKKKKIKVRSIAIMVKNKFQYGSKYSPETEEFLRTVVFPLLTYEQGK